MTSNKLPKVLSKDQVKSILKLPNIKSPTGLRNRTILQVLYRCGLRVSEVANLTPADVNIAESYIYVQQGKGKKDRYVPLDVATCKWLAKWQDQRPESDYFFSTLKGGQLDVRYVREMVYRLSKKAGVYLQNGKNKKPVNPHALRHTYATELIEEGYGIHEVQALLGHSDIKTTSVYLSVRPKSLIEKIKRRQEGE